MSEPKYIDANELRAMMFHGAFEEDSDLQRWDGGCWIRYKMFENALEQIGAADVVEVVRCKDCKHNKGSKHNIDCEEAYWVTYPEDYCSYGEEKDG